MLWDDLREAHKEASLRNPLLEMLLRDTLEQAMKLRSRLSEIQGAIHD